MWNEEQAMKAMLLRALSSIYIWNENSSPKSEVKMAEIEELLDVSFVVCAVNMMKLARSVQKFRILTSI
jgi:hypothetical protein